MDDALQQQLTQRMAELSDDVRAAVQSADLSPKIQTIGQKYQLHIDQIGLLDDEIMLVMLGFADPEEFVDNIVSQLHVPVATARLMATDVSDELFTPIRESMQRFMAERAARVGSATPATTPSGIAAPTITAAPAISAVPPAAPKPAFPMADVMLSQKTVTPPVPAAIPAPAAAQNAAAAQTQAPTPGTSAPRPYSTDPYHEPIE